MQTPTLPGSPTRLLLALLTTVAAATAQDAASDPVRAWFATPPAQRSAFADLGEDLTREQVVQRRGELLAALRAGTLALGARQLAEPAASAEATTEHALALGALSMPYVLFHKGERPANGWPLFLCLHGGGGNAEATGPHAWDVNTGEWNAQRRLAARRYPANGLYFVPRMADDRQGRWWFDHNQQAFDTVIRDAILFADVDPDRVHLLGISEGGYGAIRFAGNRPDRFAACNGMAAAEPLATSPPENMRNVALRIDIGERDTMFDRVGLARTMGERLATLRAADPGGYVHELVVQPGRGHGIDYAPGPRWLVDKVRTPRPDRVVWTVLPFHTQVALQSYWLALPERPTTMPLYLRATVREQRLELVAEVDDPAHAGQRLPARSCRVLVRLDDGMADLDRDLEITVNGAKRPAVRPHRRLATMVHTLAERGDPRLCFPAEVVVDLAP